MVIKLIVKHWTSGGRSLAKIDKGELLEVEEDGERRPAKTADPGVAFRWLQDNGYSVGPRTWLDSVGHIRRRAYVFFDDESNKAYDQKEKTAS